jgi:hypothetical protein
MAPESHASFGDTYATAAHWRKNESQTGSIPEDDIRLLGRGGQEFPEPVRMQDNATIGKGKPFTARGSNTLVASHTRIDAARRHDSDWRTAAMPQRERYSTIAGSRVDQDDFLRHQRLGVDRGEKNLYGSFFVLRRDDYRYAAWKAVTPHPCRC